MANFATCSDLSAVNTRIDNLTMGTTEVADGTSITGDGTAGDPFKVDDTWLGDEVKAKETLTVLGTPTWDSTTGLFSITFKDEDEVTHTRTTTILPTFVNTDNQQLTGDNTGSVDLTLTPVTVGGITNYTVKGDVKVDGTTIIIDPVTKELSAVSSSGTDSQTLALAALVLSISGGNNVTLPRPRRQDFTATAGQTVFTLAVAPITGVVVDIYRNGQRLAGGAVTVSGSTATYVPALNNNEALVAGDRITITHFA